MAKFTKSKIAGKILKSYRVFKEKLRYRPVKTGGGAGGGLQLLQIFAKIDLLPFGNDSEKKKVSKKIWTTSNSSKTNFDWHCIFFDILFYLLPWRLPLRETIFHKPCLFHWGYKPWGYIPLGSKPCIFHRDYVYTLNIV